MSSKPQSVLLQMMEQQLLQLRTAFIGRVVSFSMGEEGRPAMAVVQPVSQYKLEGEAARKYPRLPNVPVLKSALPDLADGALVLCVCADRDISQAIQGKSALPPGWHHKMGDAMIVGVF